MVEQIAEWQKHYECPDETAKDIEAENESEINRRNNPNRSIMTEPPSSTYIHICRDTRISS